MYFLFFDLFTINEIYAQVADDARKWDIGECIRYTRDHNIQLSTLRLNELSNEEDLYAARGEKIPSLGASVTNTFSHADISAGINKLFNQLTTGGSYSVSSSIVLWNDNYINHSIRQRGLLLQSAAGTF